MEEKRRQFLVYGSAAALALVSGSALAQVSPSPPPGAAPAQQRGTPEEAKAMVANAIIMFDADPRGSMALFNDPAGGFRDRDLYLFVIGPDAKVVAHAFDRKRVGIDVRTVRDSKDRPYGRMIIDSATHEGVWVDYIRTDPLTGEDHDKSSWVVRYKDHVFGVGVYR